ncbi:DNA-processing protein DprA [Pigmentiphaga soli]|uniref:DNA-processing protein DprA n=1 Tax=Pigmentiphaga soli TaxID=1007095 RepID=A0ABP8H0V4_9BURK
MPLAHTPEDLSGWLRLSLEPGIGPVGARELLSAFGPPDRIYAAGHDALAARLPAALARQLCAPPGNQVRAQAERTLEWAGAPQNHIVTLGDPGYPPALLNTHDPPILLYVVGDPAMLARRAIAVVGARSATAEGLDNARAFARHLALHGWCVASGLALGIDAAAHEGALEAGAEGAGTLAVIGTGADIVYPARNRALAHRVAAGGAILSELPLGTPAVAHQFPRRNRLVAGMARGVLVVEAAAHSGSLITARLAADGGREVFAIPGSIHSPLSRGCHALIRQGAKLVETAHDILVEVSDTPAADAPEAPAGQAAEAADPLLRAMGYGPVHLDELAARAGLAAAAAQARLLELELDGEIARLPGGRFQRRAAG